MDVPRSSIQLPIADIKVDVQFLFYLIGYDTIHPKGGRKGTFSQKLLMWRRKRHSRGQMRRVVERVPGDGNIIEPFESLLNVIESITSHQEI